MPSVVDYMMIPIYNSFKYIAENCSFSESNCSLHQRFLSQFPSTLNDILQIALEMTAKWAGDKGLGVNPTKLSCLSLV